MTPQWPRAELDSIARLRVIAAAIPGSAVTETLITQPFDAVWAVASDLEGELSHSIDVVRSVQIVSREADRAVALIHGHSRLRAHFEIVQRPGWCVMQSRFIIGAMAAAEDPHGTRFALLGAVRIPGARTVSPLLARAVGLLEARATRRFVLRVQQQTSSSE